MKPIIKYQVFPSTEAFEEFQTENDVSISTIMPILSNINAKESEANLDMNTQFACFVTYWENN